MLNAMLLRRLLFIWLACLLLSAQQVAAVHGLAHLSDGVPGQSQHGSDEQGEHFFSCDKSVGYTGFAAALHSAEFVFYSSNAASDQVTISSVAVLAATPNFYSPRAPPSSSKT